ncbi:kinase-like domain-containing protein [Mycena maculata]|uniref:Kinase-like domain-containing protein n=1 Tax=Mycena maculata TaxID=230809 RepID=A0AAD7IMZ8_9AGAR|nr:kinase-like domain-containing protein [Mycena maculata]
MLSKQYDFVYPTQAKWREHTTVAVKRWHAAVVENESRVLFVKVRLVRDLERWRSLKHSNIAPVHGVVLHVANLPALVLPWNRTVSEVLKMEPSTIVLPLVCLTSVHKHATYFAKNKQLQGVAAGLSYLHAQTPAIPHGDLKCSTVFVTSAGEALLSDIGIASIPRPPNWDFNYLSDARWLAPEVINPSLCSEVSAPSSISSGQLPVTRESDVYSFGMLSYEMYTRTRPFGGVSSTNVVIYVAGGIRPQRPNSLDSPQLRDEMWELIQHCWAHDFAKRPKMADVASHFLVKCARTSRASGQVNQVDPTAAKQVWKIFIAPGSTWRATTCKDVLGLDLEIRTHQENTSQ